MELALPTPCATCRRFLAQRLIKEPDMPSSLPQALLNSLTLPVLAIDDAGQVLELNEAVQRLLPADTVNPIGEPLGNLFPALASIIVELESSPAGFQREATLAEGYHVE